VTVCDDLIAPGFPKKRFNKTTAFPFMSAIPDGNKIELYGKRTEGLTPM